MTRSLILASVVTLAACGGSDSPGPTEPPDTSPAVLEVSAGDQQVADGGEPVAVAPAVRVRDASGRAVSGVSVLFTVDMGGGTVAGGSAITNGSGVATVGSWTLGPSGEQRLSARVGTLTPVVFEASITPGTELVIVTMGPGAETVGIQEDGHPFEGLEIDIPVGTWDDTDEWVFEATDAPSLTFPAGYAIQGAALEITTRAGRGNDLLTVRVPAFRDADHNVVIALYDPDRDVLEVLPTVARGEDYVEVMTTHLNASYLVGPSAQLTAAAGGPLRQGTGLGRASGLLLRIVQDLPVAPAAGTVNPWPVIEHGSATYPEGHGAAIPVLEYLAGTYAGFPLFSDIIGHLDIPGFYAEAGPLAAVQIVHRRVTQQLLTVTDQVLARLQQMPKAERDLVTHQDIVASLALAGRPPLVGFSNEQSLRHHIEFGLVLNAAEASVSARVPATPSLVNMQRAPGGWGQEQFPVTGDGTPRPVDGLVALPSFVTPFETIRDIAEELVRLGAAPSDEVRAAINADLAAQAGLPDPTVEFKDLDGDAWAPVEGEVQVWSPKTTIRIAGGPFGTFTFHLETGELLAESQPNASLVVGAVGAIADLPPLSRVFHVMSTLTMVDGVRRQIVPIRKPILQASFEATPKQVMVDTPEDPVELAVEFAPPLNSGFRIEWAWGDGEVTENLGLLAASHTYAKTGAYQVVATLIAAGIGFRLDRDTVQVMVGESGSWQGVSHHREFATVLPVPPGLQALHSFLRAMAPTDIFVIARPAGGGMEDVVMLLLPSGTGAALEEPPTGPGFGGIELLVQRAPEGTLAEGVIQLSGSGTFDSGPTAMDYQVHLSFADGGMTGSFTAKSQAREPDYDNPYFQVYVWSFQAERFTPPEGAGG